MQSIPYRDDTCVNFGLELSKRCNNSLGEEVLEKKAGSFCARTIQQPPVTVRGPYHPGGETGMRVDTLSPPSSPCLLLIFALPQFF